MLIRSLQCQIEVEDQTVEIVKLKTRFNKVSLIGICETLKNKGDHDCFIMLKKGLDIVKRLTNDYEFDAKVDALIDSARRSQRLQCKSVFDGGVTSGLAHTVFQSLLRQQQAWSS